MVEGRDWRTAECGRDVASCADLAWAPLVVLSEEELRERCGRRVVTGARSSPEGIQRGLSRGWQEWLWETARSRSLAARLDRLYAENAGLQEQLSALSERLDRIGSEQEAEMQDYLERERKLYEFANTLPEPPDYGTDDPWEIARQAGEELEPGELEELFGDD